MQKAKQVEQPTKNPTFTQYCQAGLCVIPEKDGIPTFAWSKVYKENYKPTPEELLDWDLAIDYNYGLVTGSCSGVIAIDLDYVSEAEQQRAIELLGDTPCKKKGSKGITLFYKYNNERNCNWIKDNVVKAELLSTGRKTTIPPSAHRKTSKPYIWIGAPLIDCYDKLPTLPANYMELLDSLFSIIRAPEREYARSDFDLRPSYNDAVEALNYCDANCSNADWVQIGMAFRSEVGDAGYQDFQQWSSKGKSYDKGSIRSRWRSFNSHSISYGTLIHFAKQGGYTPPKKAPIQPTISMSVDDWTSHKLSSYAEMVKESEEVPDFYTNAPHHIKVICDWITSTARYPQPIITLGAVISFLGFYMGRDFVYKGIKPNIYNINIARTGHGKEHILACIRGLMRELNLSDYTGGGGATSDTAIFVKLNKLGGRYCYLIDEFQGFMKVLSSKSGNAREGGLTGLLLKAYTSREIQSVDFADDEDRPTIKIKNPFMSLLTFCTPEPFYNAVGSTEAFNGFVGRLTIFEAPKLLPQRNKNHYPEADLNVPQDIIEILKGLKAARTKQTHPDGSFTYAEVTQVKETPEAFELIERINDEIDDKRREYDAEDNQMSNVIARVFEIMKKYTLIASKGGEITIEHITWAKALADYNIGIMVAASSNLADTGFERKKNHVVEFIQKRGGMVTKSHLTNYCKIFEGRREREEIIADLIESGRLSAVDAGGNTKSATGYKLTK
jgi:hypothetical protein